MPKRRIDPTTGKPRLTNHEQRVIAEYIKNGGNGSQAAVSAGYDGPRPDQAAYRVLSRPEVQRRIRERIAQSRVSADEISGTLVSIMHDRPGDLYDESGKFSILVAKQNGADHLIKSISETTRTIEATKTRPAQVIRTYRVQIHSPVQAATAVARILGINAKTLSRSPAHRPLTLGYRPQPTDFAEALAADFQVSTWLEDLIDMQMNEQGLSRDAVAEQLLQVRPEIAKYLRELPDPRPHGAVVPLTPDPCPQKALGQVLDFMIGLASDAEASPNTHPVLETHQQIQALMDEVDDCAVTPDAARDAISRINNRLSDQQRQDLHRLQVETLIHDNITEGPNPLSDSGLETPDSRLPTGHLSAKDIDAIRQQAAELADLQSGAPSPEFVDQCIAAHPASLPPLRQSSDPASTQDSGLLTPDSQRNLQPPKGSVEKTQLLSPLGPQASLPASAGQAAPTQDSGLETPGSPSPQDLAATKNSAEKTQFLSLFSPEPLGPQASPGPSYGLPASGGQAAPTPDSELQAQDSSSNVQPCQSANVPTLPDQNSGLQARDSAQMCEPANVPTLPAQDSRLETQAFSWAEFERKYARIDRGYIFGCDNRYIDVIRNIMNDETLSDAQAIEEMRRERHRSQWQWDNLIEPCIADYAKMHPRLAGYTIPPLPPPLLGIERYFRPQPQPAQPPGDGSTHPIPASQRPRELRGS